MSFEALQRRYGDFYSPRFEIAVENVALNKTKEFTERDGIVSDLTVDTTLDGADQFSFGLNYEYDPEFEDGAFVGLDWDLFTPGTRVDIAIGYEERSLAVPMLAGRIKSVRTDFPSGGVPTVSVSGYDLLHDLTVGTNSGSWDDATDSTVVRRVVENGQYGLSVEAMETGVKRRKTIQDDQSDYEFLKELADRNGFELRAVGLTLYFGPPTNDPPADLTLTYGESLGSFSPELNSVGQVGEVEVRHWDPERGEEIVGTAKADDDTRAGGAGAGGKQVLRVAVANEDEAETIAEAALKRLSEGLVTGRGDTVGIPELQVGTTLELERLSDRFTNVYYVTQATHRIGGSGYGASFSVIETV